MIAQEIRSILNFNSGESIFYKIEGIPNVLIRKFAPIDFEFAGALETTLASEWTFKFDEEAYRNL
jgi:hypothetical protein